MPLAVGLLNGAASSDGQPTTRVAGALVKSISVIALKSLVAVAWPKGLTKPRTLRGVLGPMPVRSSVPVATWYEFGLASLPVGPVPVKLNRAIGRPSILSTFMATVPGEA